MTLSLLLPWFPILLGVGVGGRLLGRRRGFALGLLCALFWVVLVQASAGPKIWREGWTMATIFLGAAAIFLMGGWSGEIPIEGLIGAKPKSADTDSQVACLTVEEGRPELGLAVLEQLAALVDHFDDWLEEHRGDTDPWPEFGEFVRSALMQLCRATHVKVYRVAAEGNELVPIRESDPLIEGKRLSARHGLLGHVVMTGRSYLAGDPTQGELIEKLAEKSDPAMVWSFSVSRGTERLGAVLAGQLDLPPLEHKPVFRAAEQLISLFWCALCEAAISRQAGADDPGSGLLNRAAFLQAAHQAVRESYALGEPIAVALIAIEGCRELNDSGRWELADELIREAADSVRRKVRMDDRLGRFDETRFIWLLRRVDAELASLIVKQVMARLTPLCGDESRWKARIVVRCGVVGSGRERPDLRTMVCRALTQSKRARIEKLTIASELDGRPSEETRSTP